MTPEMASQPQNQEIVWQHQESNDGPMKTLIEIVFFLMSMLNDTEEMKLLLFQKD
jgi:hypothetical protein